ncbi:MAG: SufE family protein [Chloroflexi bacterium]|nr:SufE family protein [Chloroflexota bacterium]
MSELPPGLAEIVEDFNFCVGQEKLEYLLEFAEALPPLPAQFADKRDEMEEVHECITPVFIYAEEENRRYHYHFDIPQKRPLSAVSPHLARRAGWLDFCPDTSCSP